MERNNSKLIAVISLVAVILLALGVWAWTMNNDDTTNTDQNNDSAMVEENNNDQTTEQPSQDVVEAAIATESLSTLVTALQAANLVETLQGEGPFTVFAPTNDAFDKLPEGTLDDLLREENQEQLASLLQYHVVSGEVMSSQLSDGQVVTTLNGATLTVEIEDSMVYLVDEMGGRATVTTPDVEVSNGVVHIIDTVVMPQ